MVRNLPYEISEILYNAKQKKLIPLNLQLFAAKNEPPAEPPTQPAEPPKKEEKEETPKWAQTIIDLLQQKPQSNNGTKTEPPAAQIPVPQPPKPKEEDVHQEPKEKKQSFLDWLL